MTNNQSHMLSATAERELVLELGAAILASAAPEELPIYSQTATEFFTDPQSFLRPRNRDVVFGFGVDMALVTPIVLVVATEAIRFLAAVVVDIARAEGSSQVGQVVRRYLRRPCLWADRPPTTGGAIRLSTDQARALWMLVHNRAGELGLAEPERRRLADSTVASLIVG